MALAGSQGPRRSGDAVSAYMAAFGYELLAALEELMEEFEETEASGDHSATISFEHFT
jgi:hypothetical protein